MGLNGEKISQERWKLCKHGNATRGICHQILRNPRNAAKCRTTATIDQPYTKRCTDILIHHVGRESCCRFWWYRRAACEGGVAEGNGVEVSRSELVSNGGNTGTRSYWKVLHIGRRNDPKGREPQATLFEFSNLRHIDTFLPATDQKALHGRKITVEPGETAIGRIGSKDNKGESPGFIISWM